jgi:SAM-dependent methyltransferase
MMGIDQSESSIQYAKELCASLPAEFLCGSYLEKLPCSEMDGAIMISQDYGVLSTKRRKTLLKNIHTALKPGGVFAFDVASLAAYQAIEKSALSTWSAAEKGFWRAHPYLVLEDVFCYPDASCTCYLYAVLEDTLTVYRIWQTYFTQESIAKELDDNGFTLLEASANLSGDDWTKQSLTIGVICKRAD